MSEQVDDAIEDGNNQRQAKRYGAAEQAYRLAIRLEAKDSRAYVGLGNIYSDQKKYAEAINFFSEAIRLNPKDPSAYFGRGFAYFELDKDKEAIEDGKQAVRLDTNEDMALWGVVYLYNNRKLFFDKDNRLEAAVLFYEEQIRRKPDYVKAYIALGWAYDLWNQPAKTVDYYTKAIRLKPDYDEAYRWLADIYRRQNQTQAAIDVFKLKIDTYKSLIRSHPNSSRLYLTLASAYEELEQYTESIENLKQYSRMEPNDGSTYERMGNLYADKLKQPSLAREAYNGAADAYKRKISKETNPQNVSELYKKLGDLYANRLGQDVEASEAYKQAARINPANYHYVIEIYEKFGSYASELEVYKQWILATPDDLDNAYRYRSMGDLLRDRLKQTESANEAYKKAADLFTQKIRSQPDYVEYYIDLGDLEFNLTDYEAAARAYQQAINLSGKETKVYIASYNNKLGVAFYSLGKYSEAAGVFNEAIRLNPIEGVYYSNVCDASFKLKRYEDVVKACTQAIGLKPKLIQPHYYLGEAYIALGNRRGAEAQLNFFNSASADYQKSFASWISEFVKDFHNKWPKGK